MPNVFTSRSPHNPEDIDICMAMLEDSPFWDSVHSYPDLSRSALVGAWVDLLSTGRGYIDIIENQSYDKILRQTPNKSRKNPRFERNFHSIWLVAYFSKNFLHEIITRTDIPDIGLHFMQALVAHRKNPELPNPTPTPAELMRGHNQEPGYGLYNFSCLIVHPEIKFTNPRIIIDAAAYVKCIWRSAERMNGGLSHHAWLNNVYGKFIMQGFIGSGHKLLREHPNNKKKSNDEKKYFLLLTKDQETSENLGVPKNVNTILELASNYCQYFDHKPPIAALTWEQQYTAYLVAVGYTPAQIADVMHVPITDVNAYQRNACRKLRAAGYNFGPAKYEGKEPVYTREDLQEIIKENLHEVRSFIVPLYPWPEGLYLR